MDAPLAFLAVGLVVCAMEFAGSPGSERETAAQVREPPRLSTGQVCAGLFPGEGGKALERVLQSTTFEPRDGEGNPDVREVARVMEDAYRSGREIRWMPQAECEVRGVAQGGRIPSLRVRFTADSKLDEFREEREPGVSVSTGLRKRVYLSYECVSPRAGSTRDAPLEIAVFFHERRDESEGAAVLRPDHLALTHSAALAVAKELRCADDGGLPARAEQLPAAGQAQEGSAPKAVRGSLPRTAFGSRKP
ncbi:hypothetical protein ACQKM2_07760 [Streptomyces sp. NPDC004126]|uniref:hypothetical protein n=1 Tax=Streptomyces sp. NPDC004126 TaxID=3390695 RepID=UPI003D039472